MINLGLNVLTKGLQIAFTPATAAVGAISSLWSSPVVVETAKDFINPFEWYDKCPAAADFCPIFSNVDAPSLVSAALTFAAENPLVVGAGVVGSGLLTAYGMKKAADRRRQTQPSGALVSLKETPLALATRSANSLGIVIVQVEGENNKFAVVGTDRVVSSELLGGLMNFGSSEDSISGIVRQEMDFQRGTVEYNGNGHAIPFKDIEALYRLTHQDLPRLAQLGVITLRLNENGSTQIILNKKELPEGFELLAEGSTKRFLNALSEQPDQTLTVRSDRRDLNLVARNYGEIISLQEQGLVPVYGPEGQEALVAEEAIGQLMFHAFQGREILLNPEQKEDGTAKLVIKVTPPPMDQGDGPLRVQRAIVIDLVDAQQIAHQLVKSKMLSLKEKQDDYLKTCGF